MKKILIIIFFIFVVQPVYADQCDPGPLPNEIAGLTKNFKYSKKFCDGIKACNAQRCDKDEQCVANVFKVTCDVVIQDISDVLHRNLSGSNAKGCGLTMEELSMIAYYTGSGSSCLNQSLRKPNQWSDSIQYLIDTLNSGLIKLPVYRGFVVRGGNLPASIKKEHKIGAIVRYKAFTSTSTNLGFFGPDRFIVFSKFGRPVMGYSQYTQESEVLFPAFSSFKVLDRFEESGITYYVMKEVTGKTNANNDKREDAEILAKFKEIKNIGSTDARDLWICDTDEINGVPKKIYQKNFPSVNR